LTVGEIPVSTPRRHRSDWWIISVLVAGLVAVPAVQNFVESRRDCRSRRASGQVIERVFQGAVTHAFDTEGLMDEIGATLREQVDPDGNNPAVQRITAAIDRYRDRNDDFAASAREYEPVTCP
jgi:hypothetical protein